VHKHSCHCLSPHRRGDVERVEAPVATESRGRAAGPDGMRRNATVGVNQADTKVYKTHEMWAFCMKRELSIHASHFPNVVGVSSFPFSQDTKQSVLTNVNDM